MQEFDYNRIFRDKPYLYQLIFRALEDSVKENFPYKTAEEIFALLAENLKFEKEGSKFEFSLLGKRITITNRIKNVSEYIQPLLCFQWPEKVIKPKKRKHRRAA